MAIDLEQVRHSLQFEPSQVLSLKQYWRTLMDLCVWGQLESGKLGALPRLRKRVLEMGENLASLFGNREWIPQPHQQLKSALGTSVKVRDSLLALERSAVLVEKGADYAEFEKTLIAFRDELLGMLERHEAEWASLLESQLDEADDE